MTSKSLLMKASLIAISVATLMAAAPQASRADDGENEQIIQVAPVGVSTGNQLNIGQPGVNGKCPCFRWTVAVKVGAVYVETQDVLISSEALLKFQQSMGMDFQKLGSRILTAGAAELLAKKGYVGVGFKGLSVGQDKDRGFSELMRAGLYVMASIASKSEAIRGSLRSGWDFDQVATVTNKEATRHFLTQEAVLTIGRQRSDFQGELSAFIALNPESLTDTKTMRGGSSAAARVRITNFEDLQLGVSAKATGSYDPFLEVLGLKPFAATGMLMMDLSWVAYEDKAN